MSVLKRVIPWLCDKSKVALDVGALEGSYSVHLVRYFKRWVAFERPKHSEAPECQVDISGDPRLQVESTVVGDHSGEALVRVPIQDAGRSTLALTNLVGTLGALEVIPVPVRRLDD